MPGVFAVGDVRRSIKRDASAVGEGAVCIRVIHDYLSAERESLTNASRTGDLSRPWST